MASATVSPVVDCDLVDIRQNERVGAAGGVVDDAELAGALSRRRRRWRSSGGMARLVDLAGKVPAEPALDSRAVVDDLATLPSESE